MKLTVMENSFNSYGGSVVFKPLEALISLEDVDFGTALSVIILTLQFNCKLPFEQQNVNKSLRSSYDKFIDHTESPRRIFRRKKSELEICTKARFVSSEDFFPKSQAQYKKRNETYFKDWNLQVLEILKAELIASKNKFKKTDDFDFEACLMWIESLRQKLPETKDHADNLIETYNKQRSLEYSKLSEWERLGIDWSDYHVSARDVVPLVELWSITNEFAPNGNDTGADVLYSFETNKEKVRKSKDEGRAIFEKEWEHLWGKRIPQANGNYDDLALNDYRKFTIGFAYGFLKHLGFCPEWLKAETCKHIKEYEEFAEREYSEWEHLDELKAMNQITASCLEKAPS